MKKINYQEILEFTKELLAIPSPSGFTHNAMKFLMDFSKKNGFDYELLNNGSLVVNVKGESDYTIGVSGHVDTLGVMVSAINPNGTLKFTTIGGPILPTYDAEYCLVHTRDGKTYTGTILSNSPAVHVYDDARSLPRDCDHMHIRLDELVKTKEDTTKLGVSNGDYVSLDPKTVITDNGFIKSRFLDDKLSVGIMFMLLKHFKENNITPKYNLKFIVTNYEEVGFGSSYIPKCDELLAVDMGCIGLDLEGSEEKVSICAKDAAGPYNYELTSKLINLAKANNINYCVDVFPHYSSDVSAALRAGNNIKGALIGSGVAASHGMERSHINGVKATFDLLKLYLLN